MIKKIISIIRKLMGRFMPKTLSRILFLKTQRKHLDLLNPKTFNEKLMWLKFNDYNKNEDVWKCCDKFLVREYAQEKGVSETNLPKLLGTYDDAGRINFDILPDKFVLKCTHGCGFNIICTNKENLDAIKIKCRLNKWLRTKFGYETAETHYLHEKPRIICEEFIESMENLPYDYKIYCFNGIPKCILVCSERDKGLKLNFYDLEWNEIPLGKEELRNNKKINKPNTLNEMIQIAKMVSKNFSFVRVDFFESNNKPILGELTFTPAACIAKYYSDYGQEYLGKLLDLNIIGKDK